MKRTSFSDMTCSIARSLDVLGEWWTLLILRDAFLGVSRFEDWQARLGIARNVLTDRLESLTQHGVLQRDVYDEARNRADYVLTEKGRALWPVLSALRQWGDDWEVAEVGPPLLVEHRVCGEITRVDYVCAGCGERLQGPELRFVDGPGARAGSLIPGSAGVTSE